MYLSFSPVISLRCLLVRSPCTRQALWKPKRPRHYTNNLLINLCALLSAETPHVGHARRTWKNRRVCFASLICQTIHSSPPASLRPCSQTPIRAFDTLHVSVCKVPLLSLCPPTNDPANTLCLVVSDQLCTDHAYF